MKKPTAPKPTKLSIVARNSVAMSLFTAARDADAKHLNQQEQKLALAVLDDAFGENWRASAKALPKGWLPVVNHIRALCSNNWGTIYLTLPKAQAVPHIATVGVAISQSVECLIINYTDKRYKHTEKFSRGHKSSSHPPFLIEIRQALAAIGTVEALKEQWPEAYELLPKEPSNPAPNHPVPAPIYADVIALYRTFVKETADVASV